MSYYAVKYTAECKSIRNDDIRISIESPTYDGYPVQLYMPIEQPVTLERAGEGLYGLFGTVAKVRFIDTEDFPIDPADFVVNQYTDLRLSLYINEVLQFQGYIVLDDVVTEYRVKPTQVELTFSDNLSQLSEVESPFTIDEQFTQLPEVISRILALTGLEFDLSIFFSLQATGNYEPGLTDVKIVPRGWMESLTTYRKAKEMLNELLLGLRCRLYQLRGEWVMIRVFDYQYAAYDTLEGIRYSYGTYVEEPVSLECALIDSLIPLSFSQTVTHKRAVVKVQDTFKLEPLPGIWNADLQELGPLVSSNTVGNTRTDKYEILFWDKIGAGFQNTYIVVETDTVTESELNRYLEIPFSAEPFNNDSAIRLNPILVSRNDTFNFKFLTRAPSDSNFAFGFSVGIFLAGQSGTNYKVLRGIQGALAVNRWTTTTETVDNFTTDKRFIIRGAEDASEWREFDFNRVEDNQSILANIRFIPENGTLYIKLGANKNVNSNYADLAAHVKDLQYEYFFQVNDSILVESQRHTTTKNIESLNIIEREIAVDDCIKYSASGALYNADDDNTTTWIKPDGYDEPLGKINTEEELNALAAGRKVINGIFEGTFEFNNFADFGGNRHIPTRLLIDYKRNQVQGDWQELADAGVDGYGFTYQYKENA